MSNLAQRLRSIGPTMARKLGRTITIPFTGYAPDRLAYGNPGEELAEGVFPRTGGGYGALKRLVSSSNDLGAEARGLFSAQDTAGNVFVYAATRTAIKSLVAGTWSDVSKSGGYSTAADGQVEAAQFGQTIIFTNYDDAVQAMTIGGAAFADLITSTNKPKARHVDVVKDFLVLGNTNDTTDGQKPSRVWWSAINDATDFDPAQATQCDFQDIPDGGWIQKVVGGEYGLIFQERQIVRMTYVGPPLIFQFDVVERDHGTPIPGSVIPVGRDVYYISEEGFHRTDGIRSYPVGNGKVDRFFWDNFNTDLNYLVTAGVDPFNNFIIWALPGSYALLYNYVEDKWSSSTQDDLVIDTSGSNIGTINVFARAATQGLTLDQLDTISTNIDTGFTQSFDSRIYTGGTADLFAIANLVDASLGTTTWEYGAFTGTNLAASITTGTRQFMPGEVSLIRTGRALVDTTSATLSVSGGPTPASSAVTVSSIAAESDGHHPMRHRARYQNLTINIPAGTSWTTALGIEVDVVPAGRR